MSKRKHAETFAPQPFTHGAFILKGIRECFAVQLLHHSAVRSAAIASPHLCGGCFPVAVLQRNYDFNCSDIPPDSMSCQHNPE